MSLASPEPAPRAVPDEGILTQLNTQATQAHQGVLAGLEPIAAGELVLTVPADACTLDELSVHIGCPITVPTGSGPQRIGVIREVRDSATSHPHWIVTVALDRAPR